MALYLMKDFEQEIYRIFDLFKKGSPFAFSKFADGEWAAILNESLNNGEFENNHNIPDIYRQKLLEALQFKDKDYYIGTCCPCCNGDRAQKMRELSGQDEDHMTFANVFVNTNYKIYKETFLKEYSNYDVHLIANEKSQISNLPFKIEKFYPVGFSAWVNNYNLIEEILNENYSNKLFLFCCGPFGNILSHQLHLNNKNNIYLDIGSTLNPWLQSEGFKRDYYCDGYFSNRTCVWN
jgi:hypothetical protein